MNDIKIITAAQRIFDESYRKVLTIDEIAEIISIEVFGISNLNLRKAELLLSEIFNFLH